MIARRGICLGILVLLLASSYLDRAALGLLIQPLKTELSLTDTQIGLLTGIAFAIFYAGVGVPLARVADRGNRKLILAASAALWGVAVAACGLATNFGQLLAARILVAIGEAGCIPPALSLISDYFERAERPRAISIFMLGAPLSAVLGYFLAGWLGELLGWRLTLICLAIPGLILSVLAYALLFEPRSAQRQLLPIACNKRVVDVNPTSALAVVATLWRIQTFRHLLTAYSILAFFGSGLSQWLPTFFVRTHRIEPTALGAWFALIAGGGGIIGTYLGGEVASRLAADDERLQLLLMAGSYCLFAVAYACMYLAPTTALALLFMSIAVVGGAIASGPLLATLQSIVPEHMRAQSVSLLYLSANLIGLGLGPVAIGVLSDRFVGWAGDDSLRYALLLLCPGYLWSAAHLWFARRTVSSDVRAASDPESWRRRPSMARSIPERLSIMQKDLRGTVLYTALEALWRTLREPGTGQVSDASEICVAPNGSEAVFSGTIVDTAVGLPPTRICRVRLDTGDVSVLTFGPNADRLPKYSPDGRWVAFLSDRDEPGNFQLYLLETATGAARRTPPVDGWVEYLHWSADGEKILLGVAGHGADMSGGQGAITSQQHGKDLPAWMPRVDTGNEPFRWRTVWVHDLDRGHTRLVSPPDTNIWEAAWCGSNRFAAINSAGPSEGLWYSAQLSLFHDDGRKDRDLYTPTDQLGRPSAPASGKRIAFVEGVCSDRWVVAGELQVIDLVNDSVVAVPVNDIDVTFTEWHDDERLVIAGHRNLETVIAVYDHSTRSVEEKWTSVEPTVGGFYVTLSRLKAAGDCVLIGRGFRTAPEVALIERGEYRRIRSFDLGYGHAAKAIGAVESLSWHAPDGLEIQGLLVCPTRSPPHPTIGVIHGGPVWAWRPFALTALQLALLGRGYALFFPNPRGSSGRGRAFARLVVGDMGGADTFDYLSGFDHLVASGRADPTRLGLTGASYGGFMTSWLITQDQRFRAAVPVAPVTNQVTEHLISNIPHFVQMFLADAFSRPGGRYHDRSPVMHAHKVATPTLSIAGALDRCTPAEEAIQFHNALLHEGVTSALAIYPQEGHGIRHMPAFIDYAARTIAWFDQHIGAASPS